MSFSLIKVVNAAPVVNDPLGAAPLSQLETVFGNVVTAVLALGGIVMFFSLVMSGFSYLTAGDNPKQAEGAKNQLTYTIFGFILLVMAFLILTVIDTLTGANGKLLQFKITL